MDDNGKCIIVIIVIIFGFFFGIIVGFNLAQDTAIQNGYFAQDEYYYSVKQANRVKNEYIELDGQKNP